MATSAPATGTRWPRLAVTAGMSPGSGWSSRNRCRNAGGNLWVKPDSWKRRGRRAARRPGGAGAGGPGGRLLAEVGDQQGQEEQVQQVVERLGGEVVLADPVAHSEDEQRQPL